MGFNTSDGSYNTGLDEHLEKEKLPVVSSGDATLDELLSGGFRRDFTYLLYGDRKITSKVLLSTSIQFLDSLNANPSNNKEKSFGQKVAIVDCNNRFNPYTVSKLAANNGISPSKALNSLLISRAFTYEQMIELLENRLAELEQIGAVFISGITKLWPNYDQQTFEDLLKAINGIKKTVEKLNPLLIITAPKNAYSDYKPVGGNILYHFGQVLILIENKEKYVDYKLVQHPSSPENSLRKWKPRKPKRGLKVSPKNTTLDGWF